MTAPPMIDYTARLVRVDEVATLPDRLPDSWAITHGLGRPWGGTYTEVAFDPECVDPLQTHLDPQRIAAVLDEAVRRVAADLYGTSWAFTYRPEQFDDAIARHGMRRRELVIVTRLTVFG